MGDYGIVVGLAAGRNGPTRGLLDASHRGVVGGAGVEGQENGGVVICVEHPVNGPSRELDGLKKNCHYRGPTGR